MFAAASSATALAELLPWLPPSRVEKRMVVNCESNFTTKPDWVVVGGINCETSGKSGELVVPTMTRFPCGSTAAAVGASGDVYDVPPKSKLASTFPCPSVLIARICCWPEGSCTVATTKRLPEAPTVSAVAEPEVPIGKYRATNWFGVAQTPAVTKVKKINARAELDIRVRSKVGFLGIGRYRERGPDAGIPTCTTIHRPQRN